MKILVLAGLVLVLFLVPFLVDELSPEPVSFTILDKRCDAGADDGSKEPRIDFGPTADGRLRVELNGPIESSMLPKEGTGRYLQYGSRIWLFHGSELDPPGPVPCAARAHLVYVIDTHGDGDYAIEHGVPDAIHIAWFLTTLAALGWLCVRLVAAAVRAVRRLMG